MPGPQWAYQHDAPRLPRRPPRLPDDSYDDWTRDALYQEARRLDVDGRSRMTKDQLVAALEQLIPRRVRSTGR